ncbi:metal ABC transporter permease [uncultured Methylobacterium sp.]|uniref:metal ABC transporter permease n=1 Tax=uncultured Methylobacterium sp. TaxID=157278 RepID=UPI0035C98965
MKTLTTLAAAGLMTLSGAAFAAPVVERVRGTIETADGTTLTIRTVDGATETVDVGGAKFAWVVKSSLDQIRDGVFIGTATKGENPMTALEVVLFPEAMRGTGEGHYGWDSIADQTGGGAKVKSSMTNGTVKAGTEAPKVKSAMTNATVSGSKDSGGAKTLQVSYGKDGTKTIEVPPTAPVVAFEPADKAIVTPGAKVFAVVAKDGGKAEGRFVAVGKDGLTPPM